tara:strand:- start:133 stop:1137 length:1005 start_codon:yes stop_codon:yes gene_type:complete
MEGTFIGNYESKINKWGNLIKEDPENSKKYENEMHTYMAECLPYMKRYIGFAGDNESEKKKIFDPVFNTYTTEGIKRKEIFQDYLRQVENFKGSFPVEIDPKNKKKKGNGFNKNLVLKCNSCNSNNVFYDNLNADNVCMNCGVATSVLGEELTYKEEQEQNEKMITPCGYKKENHLNEWILQFQGREATNIPTEVIEQLRSEFKKQKIKKISEISREKVRLLLKKLKLTKYYEHSTHITHILNGLKPPEMSQELEDRLRLMFKEIQEPFQKACPPDRNNFLSYSYVLYKFCELLSQDEYLPFFPLLKSKEKLHQQDIIWQKICKEVKWEYISTI